MLNQGDRLRGLGKLRGEAGLDMLLRCAISECPCRVMTLVEGDAHCT